MFVRNKYQLTMKNLILVFTLCFTIMAVKTSAQVTPIDDRGREKPTQIKKEKIYSEEEEETKKQLLQVQLRVFVEGKNVQYKFDKVDLEQYRVKDKSKYIKIEMLEKLREYNQKENFQLLAFLNAAGIKVVSHSFAILGKEEREVHYYILEL